MQLAITQCTNRAMPRLYAYRVNDSICKVIW